VPVSFLQFFFKEHTSILLNNCFSFLAEGVRTEKDSSLKPHPLKPEKSAEGKDKNNSIVLDY